MTQATALVRVGIARASRPSCSTTSASSKTQTFSLWFCRSPQMLVDGSLLNPRAIPRRSYSTLQDTSRPTSSKLPWIAFIGLAVGGAGYVYETSTTAKGKEKMSFRHFTPLKLLSVHALTPETSLFKLELPKDLLPEPGEISAGPIKSVYVMQPDLQIQRPYTPLDASSFEVDGSGVIELVVKRYEDGELSRWMHRLSPGAEVRVRGPAITWEPPRSELDEIVFIVGGTGITPAYQYMVDALKKSSSPLIKVIYSSPSPSSILLKSSLDEMAQKHPSRLSVTYLVDRTEVKKTWFDWSKSEGPIVGRVSKKIVGDAVGDASSGNRMVIVCGPEGMIASVAGPRGRNHSQGPVGGVLQELGYTSSQVVKL